MKIALLIFINLLLFFPLAFLAKDKEKYKTYCNPLNLNYRFMIDKPFRREAADPVIVLFKDLYYLFASKSGGYWYSDDMREWTFVVSNGLPIEDYAPALLVVKDKIYFTAVESGKIFSSDDPKTGQWNLAANIGTYFDPALFQDDDGKVYMYSGCGQNDWITVYELDPENGFSVIGEPVKCFTSDFSNHGWERRGDANLGDGPLGEAPWIEGAWMTKHNGFYYLQYAAPGTEFKTYGNGVYVSRSPKGPFKYAYYSPASFKPTGFITGAGHGCTFIDKLNNYWQIQTMVISVAHMFERRLGLFPGSFDSGNQMYVNTYLGDYPQFFPGEKENPVNDNFAGWMLLSYKKKCASSSVCNEILPDEKTYFNLPNKDYPGLLHIADNAFDEDVKTYWCANTGNKGEWISIDLGNVSRIKAIQINFGECGMETLGRGEELSIKYIVEKSDDGNKWELLIDKSENNSDVPHDYIELKQPVNARYLKLSCVSIPAGGKLSVRGFRVFGIRPGELPPPVKEFSIVRNQVDERQAIVKLKRDKNILGYVVRYGISPDKLYNNYQFYDGTELEINSLNKSVDYYFVIDSFNETGITKGATIFEAKCSK